MKELKYKDLLTPVKDLVEIKFRGDRPARLFKVVLPSIQKIMELDSPKLAEPVIKWDTTDGTFQGKWAAFKTYDKWTQMWIDVNSWGVQDLQTKQGFVNVKIKGYLITNFEYYNALQQGFWWTFSYLFYNRTRKKLFDQSKDYYFRVADMIKENFGILQEDITARREY